MTRKLFVGLALLCYLAVVGCVLMPGGESAGTLSAMGKTTSPATTRPPIDASELPFRGVAMQLQRVDWMDEYKKSIDEIVALGVDTVSFVVDSRQENGGSTRIYLDQRFTPSPEKLIDLIKYAKSKKLRVMLMPIVLLDEPRNDREWRGTIKPDNWDQWFTSYRAVMTQFSWIAQASNVDILVVGSELVSTEDNLDQWTQTIDTIRKIYTGRLTYSSNWDHYKSVTFWNQLDLIGMNSYWSFASGKWSPGKEKEVTPEKIQARWKEIQDEVLPFCESQKKPLLFTEVGWCSMANMAHEPWDYTKDESNAPTDLHMQQMLYEGFFNSWWGNPKLGGFMMWEWPPGDGGPEDRGYTPENKPAGTLIKEWLAKPWAPAK